MKKTHLLISLLTLTILSSSTVLAEVVTKSPNVVNNNKTTQKSTQQSKTGTMSRNSVSVQAVKTQLTKYNQLLGKQVNVNYDNLCKIQTLNKTQQATFKRYTQSYKTSLNVIKQTMTFHLEDIEDIIASADATEEKSKLSGEIMAQANMDYQETLSLTNTYLRNCSFAMPPLTYQKFLKAFEQNYYLDTLNMKQYSTMK